MNKFKGEIECAIRVCVKVKATKFYASQEYLG